MQIFYAPDITETPFLPEEESLHCVKVLRMRKGDEINIVDGRGTMYRAEVVTAHVKHTEVRLTGTTPNWGAHPYKLHMAVAPTKNIDRFEWFVEKATEIGVDTITPLDCRFSERHIIKPERIEKIIVAAAKQSYKGLVPQLMPMTDFTTFIRRTQATQRFIAHCYPGEKQHLLRACRPATDVVVCVGPEGDFSQEEVAAAIDAHYLPITLGDSRLRTETAVVAAAHIVALANI